MLWKIPSAKFKLLWCISLYLKGRMAMRMAFSWTCQPNMNDPKAQRTTQRTNCLGPLGRNHK